jgi:hypothetical protein
LAAPALASAFPYGAGSGSVRAAAVPGAGMAARRPKPTDLARAERAAA